MPRVRRCLADQQECSKEQTNRTDHAHQDAHHARLYLITESQAIEASEVQLKQSYLPKLEQALPAAKAARYLQIENKIRAVIRYELAAQIPLAQ